MKNTNLRKPPTHRGDDVAESALISRMILASKQPWRAVRYIFRGIARKFINNSSLEGILNGLPIHVIDVGAAGGMDRRWNRLGCALRIGLFEPEQISYIKLVEYFKKDNRVKIYDCALSEFGEQIDLYITRWPRSSSVFRPAPAYVNLNCLRDHYDIINEFKLPSRKLSDVYAGENIDFIKIDAEGYELPIIRGCESLIDSVLGLELEVSFQPVRTGQPFFSDVDEFCRKSGFTFMCFKDIGISHFLLPSTRLESDGFVTGGDAIYFRSPRQVVERVKSGKWHIDKFFKSIVLYLAYDKYDYAYNIIILAMEENIVAQDDPGCAVAIRIIEEGTGFNRSFFYHFKIQLLRKLL